MNKPKKWFFALVALTLLCQTAYISVNSIQDLKAENYKLTQKVETLTMVVEIKDWQYGAKVSGNNDLLKELELKEFEVLALQSDQLAVTEMVDILGYCVIYIHWLQIKMAKAGLDYPVFIIEAVLLQILEEGVINE